MIAVLAVTLALYVALTFLVLKIVQRFFGWKAVIATGIGIATLFIWGTFSIHASCGVPPIRIPPTCSDPDICGEGRMIFACDAPFGAIAYATANIVHPISALLTAIFTYFVAMKSRRSIPES